MPTQAEERRREGGRQQHELRMLRFQQPDDVTCGPTCLRKVYHYYGLAQELEQTLGEISRNEDGGTLAVFLGIAALRRDFRARIYAYDLRIFDPTWERLPMAELTEKVRERISHMRGVKARMAATAYLEFLSAGGEVIFEDLTPTLLKRILNRNHPVLAGLSATYLYRMSRERHHPTTHDFIDDDIRGDSVGHFLVVSGYEQWGRRFIVLDPASEVPGAVEGRVVVDAHRLINAVLLGDLTYDAVLLEIWPEREEGGADEAQLDFEEEREAERREGS